jgi:single-strand DNA-binding protein
MDNTVTLIGNLAEDLELRFTGGNVAMANVTIAVNRRRYKDGEWVSELDGFFRGTLWREQAENAAQSLHKGDRVMISGTLEQRSWEANDGQKRYAIEVRIDDIAPSLRWASAEVTRRPASGGGGGSGSWGGGNAGGNASGANIPAAPVARDNFGPDEAPF